MSVFGGGAKMGGHRRIERIRAPGTRIYTTNFALTENPLSEGGSFINGGTTGVDWGNFQCAGGKAWGTLATSVHDNTALVGGTWAANQYAQGRVFKLAPDNSYFPEVEFRLRSTITPNVNSGYEVGFSLRGGALSYLIIVRWNGPAGSYDYLLNATGAGYEVLDGDTPSASIVGNTITAYINSVAVNAVDITSIGGTVYTSGNPGIGQNADTGGTAFLDQYGFTQLTVGEL